MNDWLNYEGSGSSLSHSFGFGYGYDYGTTRHGSVLVHDAGPAKPLPGGIYSTSKSNIPNPKTLAAKQQVLESKWKAQGTSDMKYVIDTAIGLWRREKYKQLANYCELIHNKIGQFVSGRRNTGFGPSENTVVPPEAKNAYEIGYGRYYDMFSKITEAAHKYSDTMMNGKPNPYLLQIGKMK